MARPAETYRGYRRNGCLVLGGIWGPRFYFAGHRARELRVRLMPSGRKPHQGDREKARRLRQMVEGRLR